MNRGCSAAWPGGGPDLNGRVFTSVPHREGLGEGGGAARKRPVFTSSLEPTQILAFFSDTLAFFSL